MHGSKGRDAVGRGDGTILLRDSVQGGLSAGPEKSHFASYLGGSSGNCMFFFAFERSSRMRVEGAMRTVVVVIAALVTLGSCGSWDGCITQW